MGKRKEKKGRKVNYELIPPGHCAYVVLDAVRKEWHDWLEDARIALAWRNQDYWFAFLPTQQIALLDHELSHAAPANDNQTGELVKDDRGRTWEYWLPLDFAGKPQRRFLSALEPGTQLVIAFA